MRTSHWIFLCLFFIQIRFIKHAFFKLSRSSLKPFHVSSIQILKHDVIHRNTVHRPSHTGVQRSSISCQKILRTRTEPYHISCSHLKQKNSFPDFFPQNFHIITKNISFLRIKIKIYLMCKNMIPSSYWL